MAHLQELEKGKVSYMLRRYKEIEKEKKLKRRDSATPERRQKRKVSSGSEEETLGKQPPAIKFIKGIISSKK
jgi:hypothetical protein